MNSSAAVVGAIFCTCADKANTIPSCAIIRAQKRARLDTMALRIAGDPATYHAVAAVIAKPAHIHPYTALRKAATRTDGEMLDAVTTGNGLPDGKLCRLESIRKVYALPAQLTRRSPRGLRTRLRLLPGKCAQHEVPGRAEVLGAVPIVVDSGTARHVDRLGEHGAVEVTSAHQLGR